MAKASPKIPGEQLDEFLHLLEEAMGRGRVKRSDLAMAMNVDPSLITKIFSRQARLRTGDFSRAIAPYLIIRGGLTEPAQVRQMAELLGEQLGAADLLNIGMRAKVYGTPEDPAEIAAAFIQRVKEEKLPPPAPATPLASSEPTPDEPSLESIAQPIQEEEKLPPPTPAAPPNHSEPALDWSSLDALAQYIRNEITLLPGACGYQMPIDGAIDRSVTTKPLTGDPVLPDAMDTPSDVKRMSWILSNVAGSGQTSWMLKLASAWARQWAEGKPLAIYVHAPTFLRQSGLRGDIDGFVARTIFASNAEQVAALAAAVRGYDAQGKILWLIDDLGRMPAIEQRTVLAHFAGLPAIYGMYPWQVQSLAPQIYAPHLGEFTLEDLVLEQQSEMLTRWAQCHGADKPDLDLACSALGKVPDLARLPLGIAAIYASVAQHTSSPVQIMQRALNEYLARAGLETAELGGEWINLPAVLRSLTHAAHLILADCVWAGATAINKTRYEKSLLANWRCKWEHLAATRLFAVEPSRSQTGDEWALRFYNQDLWLYCAAGRNDLISQPGRIESHCPDQLWQQYQRYVDALYEARRAPQ